MNLNYNYKLFILNKLPILLISIIPFLLITGPFLSDLALSIVVIIFIIILIREKKFELFNNKFFYIFISFYVFILFNSLFQNQNFDSLKISFFYFRFGIFSFALMYFLDKDQKLLKYIFYCLIFCFLILIFDGLYQYYFKKNIFGFQLVYPGPRVSSFFGDELILGSYLSRLFPILFGLFLFFNKSKKKLYIYLPIWILSVILIFLSGERTAIFFITLSIILMSFLIFRNKKYVKITLIFFILFGSLILFISETARQRIINDTLNQMFFSKWDNNKILIFTRQHDEHYHSSIRMFLDNKILGVGVKNFRNFCSEEKYNFSEYTCSPHPHNTYIQLLSETGFIGFILVFSIFINLNIAILNHLKKKIKGTQLFDDLEICLIIAIYVTLWPLVPSGNFFNNWLNIIYYFPVGILMWSLYLKPKSHKY